MIPLKDNVPLRAYPFMTIILVMLNAIFFLLELQQAVLGDVGWANLVRFTVVPHLILDWPHHPWSLLTLVSHQFMHAGWMHLLGNMVYLWVFGRKVEGDMGAFRFLGFYLVGGMFAGMIHVIFSHKSYLPTLGASGAIAAVLAAYLFYFPKARLWVWIPVTFWTILPIPAFIGLGFWFLLQLSSGLLSLDWGAGQMGGTAWWAHIGGFIGGLLMAPFLRLPPPVDWRKEYLAGTK